MPRPGLTKAQQPGEILLVCESAGSIRRPCARRTRFAIGPALTTYAHLNKPVRLTRHPFHHLASALPKMSGQIWSQPRLGLAPDQSSSADARTFRTPKVLDQSIELA